MSHRTTTTATPSTVVAAPAAKTIVKPPPSDDEDDSESGFGYLDAGWAEDDDDDPDGFKVDSALSPAEKRTFTTAELHQMIHAADIELSPPYQRDVVWTAPKQSSLIDSLWHNYHIPPIVFVSKKEFDEDDGSESTVLVCVDGKQRLTSIMRFLDGQIPHKIDKTKWWFTYPDKRSAMNREIPEKWKQIFSAKEISCEIYHDITEDVEREMFRRVQLGVVLTSAEKLQAISSELAEWISELVKKHVEIDNGLSQVIRWESKRGKPFENVMTTVYCCLHYREEPTTLSSIGKWLEESAVPPAAFKADMERVFTDMWRIATGDAALNFAFSSISSPVAPVEFIFIGVLLYVLKEHDLKTKATAIQALRTSARTAHAQSVRKNHKVVKTMWGYVKFLKKHPLGDPLTGSTTSARGRIPTVASGVSGVGKKRRRKAGEEEEDPTWKNSRKR